MEPNLPSPECPQCIAKALELDNANQTIAAYKDELEQRDKRIKDLSVTINELRLTWAETLESQGEFIKAAEQYDLVFDEDAYSRERGNPVPHVPRRGVCSLGHECMEMLIDHDYSSTDYSTPEQAISRILHVKQALFHNKSLNGSKIAKTQEAYCALLRDQALRREPVDEEALKILNRAEAMHRYVRDRRDEAQGLQEDDEWVLKNGHQLGLVLRDLGSVKERLHQNDDRDQYYSSAMNQLQDVWGKRKRSTALGPAHDDTVESAINVVNMLEKRGDLDKDWKSNKIGEILREVWDAGGREKTDSILTCGYKLGKHLNQSGKFEDAENVLNKVWEARKDVDKIDSAPSLKTQLILKAQLSGNALAEALYFQKKKEKAKEILEDLWGKWGLLSKQGDQSQSIRTGYYLTWILDDFANVQLVSQSVWTSLRSQPSGLPIELDESEQFNIQYWLGWAQYELGSFNLAEKQLETVWREGAALTKQDGRGFRTSHWEHAGYLLASCREKQGKNKDANDILQKVLESKETRGANTKKIEALLKKVKGKNKN